MFELGLIFIVLGIIILEADRRRPRSSIRVLNGVDDYTLGFGLIAFGFLFLGIWILFVALILIMAWNLARRR